MINTDFQNNYITANNNAYQSDYDPTEDPNLNSSAEPSRNNFSNNANPSLNNNNSNLTNLTNFSVKDCESETNSNASPDTGTNTNLTQGKKRKIGETRSPIDQNNYDKWCSITYYELAHKTGETFFGNHPTVSVDGFTDPDTKKSHRFSLGSFTNVNREKITADVRRVIGKGIELVWRNHEVFIHCISNHSIFVQSTNCNHINNYDIDTVLKVPNGHKLKIFDMKEFSKTLCEAIPRGYKDIYSLVGWGVIQIRSYTILF